MPLARVVHGGPGPAVRRHFRRCDFQIVVAAVASTWMVRFGVEDSSEDRRWHGHRIESTDDFVAGVVAVVGGGADADVPRCRAPCHSSQTAQSHPGRGTRSEIGDSGTKAAVLLVPVHSWSPNSMLPSYYLSFDCDHCCNCSDVALENYCLFAVVVAAENLTAGMVMN